jgi:hypothetical protein
MSDARPGGPRMKGPRGRCPQASRQFMFRSLLSASGDSRDPHDHNIPARHSTGVCRSSRPINFCHAAWDATFVDVRRNRSSCDQVCRRLSEPSPRRLYRTPGDRVPVFRRYAPAPECVGATPDTIVRSREAVRPLRYRTRDAPPCAVRREGDRPPAESHEPQAGR